MEWLIVLEFGCEIGFLVIDNDLCSYLTFTVRNLREFTSKEMLHM